nr:ribonuclease H-like domain-containing protein [Tanacetum cinerariifolium]
MDPYNHSTPISTKLLILDTGKFEQWKFRIQRYLQHEHYALWEVIEFSDSYKSPPDETAKDKGPASEVSSLTKKKGRIVAITAEDMQKRKNDVKARTTLLLALPDEHQDDLDTMSMDDVYNHLKVYEPEVQKRARSPRSQNRGKRESYKKDFKVEEPNPKAMVAIDGLPEFVDDTHTDYTRPTPSIDVSKSVSKEQEERWKSNHPSFFEQGGSSGKFDAKGDEGYFVGYSLSSKAFMVVNKKTKKIEENLHVDFLENKSIKKGTGPDWLFDIDTLTNSINYVPVVVAGTSSTNISGIQLGKKSFKKLKTAEASGTEPTQEQQFEEPKELSKEELKKMMELVPRKYWKIIRVKNHTEVYQIFDDMLKKNDREDLDRLWSLVKETCNTTEVTDEKEKALSVELKRLYEPDSRDPL